MTRRPSSAGHRTAARGPLLGNPYDTVPERPAPTRALRALVGAAVATGAAVVMSGTAAADADEWSGLPDDDGTGISTGMPDPPSTTPSPGTEQPSDAENAAPPDIPLPTTGPDFPASLPETPPDDPPPDAVDSRVEDMTVPPAPEPGPLPGTLDPPPGTSPDPLSVAVAASTPSPSPPGTPQPFPSSGPASEPTLATDTPGTAVAGTAPGSTWAPTEPTAPPEPTPPGAAHPIPTAEGARAHRRRP